ncbi:MAG TPA: hypothetical protein VF173_27635 [Thermoanaerobaculia bacterium]|nr:hypothetical protein [Thermoanaerobaculia bacterium]
MRKKLVFLAFIAVAAAAQLGLFSARPARAGQCWWICCLDDSGCSLCCEDGPCNLPTCPLG